MSEEEIKIKLLTEVLNEEKAKEMWQTETRQSPQNIILETRNRFAPIQNTQDEVWDKEANNNKENETLQHRHQTPVNHFPENDKHF